MNRALRTVLALLALAAAQVCAAPSGNYARRDDVRQFIGEMVERHGFVARELRTLFGRARFQPAIIRAMTPPPEAPVKSWQAYRALFVTRDRIDAGARFRERYAAALARAAQEFGVPPEIVVAIIGVETVYGRNMGAYRVIDALTTLAFDFPRRGEFFRSELESFLLYARENGIDVLAAQGSYAGAFGIPQFMPGTFRRFAVDYDGDGLRDLNASPVDAIGSVANFLKAHGWEQGLAVAAPAQVSGDAFRKLIDAGIKPVYRIADLPAYGVAVVATAGSAEALPPEAGCALVELESPGQAPEYWVGLQNFYTLTRYNRSSFYAIAVRELAREIAQASR
jgi:membrane-bound lytic murein transglycosylase B